MSQSSESGARPEKTRGFRVGLAYRQLREMIVRGTLTPGMRLVESELVTQLELGRTPIRTALHRLQLEGFVSGTGGGKERLSVAPLTQADATEVFEIVSALECIAIRRAALLERRPRAELAKRMRARNVEFAHAAHLVRPHLDQIYDIDAAFHRLFIEAGAGPRVLGEHGTIKLQAERYMRLYISAFFQDMSPSVVQHEQMVRAIRGGDPDAAAGWVHQQWQGAAVRLVNVIAAVGERGSWHAVTRQRSTRA
jgi:DNA-binding GntR family transcriptional regulator